MWKRWLLSSLQMILLCKLLKSLPNNNSILKISQKPCTANGYGGTCMFVWECIKSEGQHVGMCVDSFMFGSCCAHNLTENVVLPHQHFDFKPPPKKQRPAVNGTNRPISSGLNTIIHRPHGDSMLVIRPSINKKRPVSQYTTKIPTDIQTTNSNSFIVTDTTSDLAAASSISTGLWSQDVHTMQWQVTTQPNFVTKLKPTQWEELPSQIKPKPTKKPISLVSDLVKQTTLPPIHSTSKPSSYPSKPIGNGGSHITKPTVITTTTTEQNSSSVFSSQIFTTPSISAETTSEPSNNLSQNFSSGTTINDNLASSVDFNDISDEILDDPKRYTISASKSVDCGISTIGRPEIRIVGGKNSAYGKWPWQVSVRRTSFFGFSSTHRCGGAIINENWIATAGHCVDDLLTSQIRIRVGEYDFSHTQEEFPFVERGVSRKVVHPKYNFFTYEFDLALVQLESPLEFAPHIVPICLPGTDDLLIGQNATVTGWGRLSEGGTLPSVLQEVKVPIVSNDRCKMMFLRAGRHEFIPDIFLCAGHDTGGHDSCQGDSGGPLQVKGKDGHYFLAGIISWGIGCAEANLPGVCTRISKFTPWILNIVK